MSRNLRSSRLLDNGRSKKSSVNPMEGVANLADCMLVLACGLMLALIVNWNLDVTPTEQSLTDQDNMTSVDQVEAAPDAPLDNTDGYEELGVVYKDPSTGQLYMVVK